MMTPWEAYADPTPAMLAWAAEVGEVQSRMRSSPPIWNTRLTGAPARAPVNLAIVHTRYGNLGRNINRAKYARISRNRRNSKYHQNGG